MVFEAHDNRDIEEGQREVPRIPDTMKTWPWIRSINPLELEDEITAESFAWVCQLPYFTHRRWDYTDVLIKTSSGAEVSLAIFPLIEIEMLIGRFVSLIYLAALTRG